LSKIEFPHWFDPKRLEDLESLERAGGGAVIGLLRDTFLSSTSQMLQVLPEWAEDADPRHRALVMTTLLNLKGLAWRMGADPLFVLADTLRCNYADERAGKPVARRPSLVADLLRECERTRAALLACGASDHGLGN
jgi:hypothetical protein